MMRLSRSMVLQLLPSLAAVALVGCTPPAPKEAPAPAPVVASPEQAAQVQADITKIIPGSLVGKVSAIRGDMAAVSGIAASAVKLNESIQFVDGNSETIANGTISSISADQQYLIVDFTPVAGHRAPINGDMAVHLPPH